MNNIAIPIPLNQLTEAQQAAIGYLAGYTGNTRTLYRRYLMEWFTWCETNQLDPLEINEST